MCHARQENVAIWCPMSETLIYIELNRRPALVRVSWLPIVSQLPAACALWRIRKAINWVVGRQAGKQGEDTMQTF